eukprot:403344440
MNKLFEKAKYGLNFMHFHRKRVFVASAFVSGYGFACYKWRNHPNEIIRMGIAGSLAYLIVESMFHFVDTVNVRAKLSETNVSSLNMARKIYRSEGLYGFSKGFSAMFYGSVACGFIYFSLYKLFKQYFKEKLGDEYNIAWTFFLASFVAEFFTLIFYYPYDLVKCRLQSGNYQFKYRNIPHAFRKEIKQGSILSLYKGSMPFLTAYTVSVSLQFTIYEYVITFYKRLYGENYSQIELTSNIVASFLGGVISSALTNSLEVLTLQKQANPEVKLLQIIKQERIKLFYKGLSARVLYHSFQSIVFFNLVNQIGKIYNVELSDD